MQPSARNVAHVVAFTSAIAVSRAAAPASFTTTPQAYEHALVFDAITQSAAVSHATLADACCTRFSASVRSCAQLSSFDPLEVEEWQATTVATERARTTARTGGA